MEPAVRPEEISTPVPAGGLKERSKPALLSNPSVYQPLAVFVLTRFLFVLLTYFGVILFNSVLHGAHPSFLHQLIPAWNEWDTRWYIEIAQRGYNWINPAGTSPTAFFPLYPLLIKATVLVTRASYLTAALVISNAAFLAALFVLWRLARFEFNRAVAARTILYISVFPTALFFFAGYTESLFLLFTAGAFYNIRRRSWLLAGVLGGLASATRVTGILLLIPFAYEYARAKNFSVREMLADWRVLGTLLIPAGLAAFMAYLNSSVGNALAFAQYQSAWQKIFTWHLWSGFLQSLREIFLIQPAASFYEAHNIINVALGGLFLVCTVLAARRLPAAYTLYLAAFWITTLASPALAGGYPVPLISMERYVLTLFPIFMYFGTLGKKHAWNDAYLVISVGMLALLTVQFIRFNNGGWVI